MFQSLPLVTLTIAWLAGISLASFFPLPLPRAFLPILAAIPLLGLFLWRRESGPRLAFACGLFVLLGALRYPPPSEQHDPLAAYIGADRVVAEGVVAAEPEVHNDYANIRLHVERLTLPDGTSRAIEGDLLARLPLFSPFAYGDRLLITGTLTSPPVFADFDYQGYLAQRGIHALLQASGMALIARDQGNPLYAALYALKAHLRKAIAASLPEPQASLLQGILLGDRSGISAALEDAFNRTGTSHILVISGYNLTIVAALFGGLGRRMTWPWRRTLSVLAGITAYTLLVGAGPSVVRAALMAVVIILGRTLRRPAHPLNSLALAAFAMTLFNPLTLWDRGFLLSLAATLGLVLYAGPLQDRISGWLTQHAPLGPIRAAGDTVNAVLAPTLAAQSFSLPLLVLWFGQLSLVTLLANMLVLPVQPALMMSGGLAALAGMIWLPLGRILAGIPWVLLTWTVDSVETLAHLPYATVPLAPPVGLVWAYYALFLAVTWWFSLDMTARQALRARLVAPPARLWVLPMGLAAIAMWSAGGTQPDGRLHVSFLDVGQGDAIFIVTPHGHQVLIDGGPEPDLLLRELGRRMPFWDHSLDLVILTHPHADHLTGLIPLPGRYDLGAVIDSGTNAPGLLWDAWTQALQARRGVRILKASAGMRIQLEPDVSMTVLNPGLLPTADVENDSVVIRLACGQVSFLLTSDINADVERALLSSGRPLASTVLKVAHHGSASATMPAFLKAVNPQAAVISVGADNRFGHPAPEVLDRLAGCTVLRTDAHGTIEFTTDGQVLWLKTER